jgi:hypothetical protein
MLFYPLPQKIANYLLYIFLCVLCACGQQTNQDIVNPSLVRVYVGEVITNMPRRNFITLDFKPTTDNGFLFFGVGGVNVATKYSLNTAFCLMKIDNMGNLLWEKYYTDTPLIGGFPSNVVATNNPDEYVFFWNKTRENNNTTYYRVTLKLNSTNIAPVLDNTNVEEVTLSAGTNVIIQGSMQIPVVGSIVRITPNLAKNGYALMSVAPNVKFSGTSNEQHVTIFNNLPNATKNATYITDLTIKGLSQGIESLRAFDLHYQFFTAQSQYFYNAPDGANGFMALASIGGTRVPVFRDSLYRIAATFQTVNNENSLLINTENQQGNALYVPITDLAPNNFDAAKIVNISVDTGQPLDTRKTAILGETSEGLTMICGTNLQSRNIAINFIRKSGEIFKTYNLANTDYTTSNIAESMEKNIIAVGGTNDISQNFKRPFVILIPKSEVLQ